LASVPSHPNVVTPSLRLTPSSSNRLLGGGDLVLRTSPAFVPLRLFAIQQYCSIFVTDGPAARRTLSSPASPAANPAVCNRCNRISAGGTIAFTDTTPHVTTRSSSSAARSYTMTVNVAGPGTVASSPYSGINCPVIPVSHYLPARTDPGCHAGYQRCLCGVNLHGKVNLHHVDSGIVCDSYFTRLLPPLLRAQKDFGSKRSDKSYCTSQSRTPQRKALLIS